MRYIQDPKTLQLIPADEYSKPVSAWFVVHGDLEPYLDENIARDGKPVLIKSKQHRRDVMRRNEVDEKFGKGWV